MPLNYAEAYQQGLEQRYAANGLLYTQKLWNSPSNGKLKFTGARTIKLPKLLIKNGRKDRTRRTITTPSANYENQWEEYTLKNERYWDTLVDPSDIDETNYATSIANITKVYNDEEKIPEMDKQMTSTLFTRKNTIATGQGIEQMTLDETNFLATFDKLMTEMDEKGVPSAGRTIFVHQP